MKLDEDIIASIKHESSAEEKLGKTIELDHKEAYGTESSVAPSITAYSPEKSAKQTAEDNAPAQTDLAKDKEAKSAAELLKSDKNSSEEKVKPDELNKDYGKSKGAKPITDE